MCLVRKPSMKRHSRDSSKHTIFAADPLMDRWDYELAVQRDRIIRLRSNYTDMALGLPYSVTLPESYRRRANANIAHSKQQIENFEQRFGSVIKPPPNKTVFDKPSPVHQSTTARLMSSEWPSGSSGRPANIFGRTIKCLRGKSFHNKEDSPPSSRKCSAFADSAESEQSGQSIPHSSRTDATSDSLQNLTDKNNASSFGSAV